MSGNIFEEVLSTFDGKGNFIEFVLYDYFEHNGFKSTLMKVMDKRGNIDQRLRENKNIVSPDIAWTSVQRDFFKNKSLEYIVDYFNRYDENL